MKPTKHRYTKRILASFGALLLAGSFLLSSCAHTAKNLEWKPGDTVVCPHCGRPFSLPEKAE